jgi:hypothetical protein
MPKLLGTPVVCRATRDEEFVDLQSKGFNFDEADSGGLYEKHAVASWYWNCLSIFFRTEGNHRVSIWPVTRSSGYLLTSSQNPATKDFRDPIEFPQQVCCSCTGLLFVVRSYMVSVVGKL